MTYDAMEMAVAHGRALWLNEVKTIGSLARDGGPGYFPREFVVGAPGIEFKRTGFRVQLRPDLPGIRALPEGDGA